MELEDGQLYWIKDVLRDADNGAIVALYSYSDRYNVGWFDLFGTDTSLDLEDVEVLGKIELIVPEYAEGYGYG